MKRPIDQEKRIIIYHNISKHPYLHFRQLSRLLNIPSTTLIYHLRYLEKNGLIISKKEGRYTRYCISNKISNIEKKIINVFRQDTRRNIILYIFSTTSASQIEMAKELEKHPTTIEFHLKKLLKNEIIEHSCVSKDIIHGGISNSKVIKRKPCKNETFYKLKEPASLIVYKTLLKYYNKKTLKDSYIKATINYTEYMCKNETPAVIKTCKQATETFEKILFEIFPHPYYS